MSRNDYVYVPCEIKKPRRNGAVPSLVASTCYASNSINTALRENANYDILLIENFVKIVR